MDRWIHFGLLGAWLAFGLAAVLWWRRRHNSKHYPYSERATAINEALKQSADLGIVYWSRSAKKFQRRVVTPLELDGYSLKAFDHTLNDVRILKITRIRTIHIVPKGSTTVPGREPVAGSVWVLTGFAAAGLTLLGVAMYRTVGPPQTDAGEVWQNQTGAVVSLPAPKPVKDFKPPEAKPVRQPERWEVVVDNNPTYDTNHVAQVISLVLRCSPPEADGFVIEILGKGYATVWRGEWDKAEKIRQDLEGDDVDARLKPEVSQQN